MLQAVKSLFKKKKKKAFIPIYNIHSYLQRSQIYSHFLKAFFVGVVGFFQIRMKNSTKMRCKKGELKVKICSWRVTVNREK